MVLSTGFLIISALSIFLGVHALNLNPKAQQNRLFFAMTAALMIWSFGFSFAISAVDAVTCLFWRRFAAFGWGIFFSIMLHYFIVFTEHDGWLEKWWTRVIIYAPAVVTLIGFTFVPGVNPAQFNLVQTSLGWVNIAENNVWDWFYSAYFFLYSVFGFFLLWRWGRQTPSATNKKQVRNILISFLIPFSIGTLTDIFGNLLFSTALPQLAPIYMILPIVVTFFTIRHYGLLGANERTENELFMTDQIRNKLSASVLIVSIAGALLNIFTQYVYSDKPHDLWLVLLFSFVMVLIGVGFFITQHIGIHSKLKDIISAVLLALAIPVITLGYADYGGVTIWSVSFICLIIVFLINKRFMINAIVISFLFTQLLLWLLSPQTEVMINHVAYISRIGLFLIAASLSFYVNKVISAKTKENLQQIEVQRLVSDVSASFVSINESNFSKKVDYMLAKTGVFFNLDHTYVFLFDASQNQVELVQQWHSSKSDDNALIGTVLSDLTTIIGRILSNKSIVVPNTDYLMEQQRKDLHHLLNTQVQSIIAIPFMAEGSVQGMFAAAYTSTHNIWSDTQVNSFKIISNILADAKAKVHQEQEINRMAFYDYLTGLPNKLLLKDRAVQAIELSKRTENALALMFLDLDVFKSVNNTMGHQAGDKMLIKISESLQQAVRKTDAVSRFGGDKFVILINHLSAVKDVILVVDKIMDTFKRPISINDQEYYMTASAGIAVYPEDGDDADTLIKNAEIAMYRAKEKGRNRYELCSPELKEEALFRMQLTNSLYRALERNELFLEYQPQIDLATKKITGVEALLRWNHPKMGLISPARFIPLAEQTGLIVPIGEWVLETACRQNKAWQDMGLRPIRIAVNISVIQFRSRNIVSRIKSILADTALDTKDVELELTESVANNESSYTIEVFNALKDLGVSLSIDDFGTEYSSLNRLKMLPVDRIKLDIQFVRDICGNKKDKAIAGIIINLAKNLDLKIIAEGVENDEQLEYLEAHKCDEVQGFYYYKPLLPEQIEALLKKDT